MTNEEPPHPMLGKKNPAYVLEPVCKERVKRIEQRITLLFGSSLVTIILILVQLVRGI